MIDDEYVLSHDWLFENPWTVALQASLSMEFSRQEHWSGLPFPSPGDLPHPEFEDIWTWKQLCLEGGNISNHSLPFKSFLETILKNKK